MEVKTLFKTTGRPLFLGHRGAMGYAAENTLESFRKALVLKADMIEFDVRRTADGKAVIMHDDTVDRTTNGSGRVDQMSLARFRKLRCANNRPPPTFKETLTLLRDKVPLNIEIKGENSAQTCVRFKGRDVSDILFSSFEWKELHALRRMLPKANIGLLWENPTPLARIFREAEKLKAISINPPLPLTTPELVKAAHKQGLYVVPWTVSDDKAYKACFKLGVDGFFTNYLDRARKAWDGRKLK